MREMMWVVHCKKQCVCVRERERERERGVRPGAEADRARGGPLRGHVTRGIFPHLSSSSSSCSFLLMHMVASQSGLEWRAKERGEGGREPFVILHRITRPNPTELPRQHAAVGFCIKGEQGPPAAAAAATAAPQAPVCLPPRAPGVMSRKRHFSQNTWAAKFSVMLCSIRWPLSERG